MHRLPCPGALRASVILLHGYSSDGSANVGDAAALARDGVEVLLPDAPGHGERADGRLERIASLADDVRPAAIHDIARQWLAELPALAAACRERGARRVAVVGISMGGFAALGALQRPCAFDAVAAVLAAPALVDRALLTPGEPPLLLGLAGRDAAVPPAPGRQLAREYGAELHDYPDSEHFMRGEDWCDLWRRVVRFVDMHTSE